MRKNFQRVKNAFFGSKHFNYNATGAGQQGGETSDPQPQDFLTYLCFSLFLWEIVKKYKNKY